MFSLPGQVILCTVHFGYSGHLIGHYIRPEYNRINVFCTRKNGHYSRINVATISGVHCIMYSILDDVHSLIEHVSVKWTDLMIGLLPWLDVS